MPPQLQDYILGGRGFGPVGRAMEEINFDPGLNRPYYDTDGTPSCTINTGRTRTDEKTGLQVAVYEKVRIRDLQDVGINSSVFNALMLRKDEWILMDTKVITAARRRLKAWADLLGSNTFTVPGMGVSRLEAETMSDPGEALVDMDGLAEGHGDAPIWQPQALPLPITHSDFFFSQRKLATSRRIGLPLNTIMAEAAGRRVAESLEQTLIGTVTGMTHGATPAGGRVATVYGYTNFAPRATLATMPAPTGANGPAVLTAWLELRDLLYQSNFYGPYLAYTSSDYDEFLDNLFSAVEPSAGTLRSRLLQIDGISSIRRLDYLTNTFTVLLIQMVPEVAQAVVGMPITTVQWDTRGGAQKNFKVMTIQCPWLHADYYDQCGIAEGTTA